MPLVRYHTGYRESGRIPPLRDSNVVVMSVLDPNSLPPTLRPHVPLHLLAHLTPPPIRFTSDMSDEPGVQFMGARSKVSNLMPLQAWRHTPTMGIQPTYSPLLHQRTHRPMSQQPRDEDQQSWLRHFHPPRSESSRPARLPPMRHPRDGFDFRRPAIITPPEDDVIDLTNEPETPPRRTQNRTSDDQTSSNPRLPRFGRNILTDVVDLEEPDNDPGEGPSSSPEVQFVSATVRPPRPPRRWGPWSSISNGFEFNPLAMVAPLSRFSGPEDLLFLAPDATNEGFALDYTQPSFAMEPPSRQESRSRRDTYKAPSPAPEGFTRTLADDDVAVCPNCEWELGTGEGKMQEIWVAKPCGHVYCGECAENRSLSKARKTQAPKRTKPFSKCQVEDCGKQVSAPTAMVHLFL